MYHCRQKWHLYNVSNSWTWPISMFFKISVNCSFGSCTQVIIFSARHRVLFMLSYFKISLCSLLLPISSMPATSWVFSEGAKMALIPDPGLNVPNNSMSWAWVWFVLPTCYHCLLNTLKFMTDQVLIQCWCKHGRALLLDQSATRAWLLPAAVRSCG